MFALLISKLTSIANGRKLDGYKNMSKKELEDLITKPHVPSPRFKNLFNQKAEPLKRFKKQKA